MPNLSILVDKLNADFPPGTEPLNEFIQYMIDYDPKERWTLDGYLRYLYDDMDELAKSRMTIAECPSIECIRKSNLQH
jgi:hypothetical protein